MPLKNPMDYRAVILSVPDRSGALRPQSGIATVEFALVASVLVVLMFGVVQFGWLLNNYAKIDSATASAARYFAGLVDSDTPRTSAEATFKASMGGMSNVISLDKLTMVTAVGGTPCATDAACATALKAAAKLQVDENTWDQQRVTVAVTWDIKTDPKRAVFGQSSDWIGLGNLVPAKRVSTASERVTVAQ